MHAGQSERSEWRRGRRLQTLFARYIVLVGGVSIAILIAFNLLRQLEAADDRAGAMRLTANKLLAAQIDQETGMRGYALTADQRFLEPYNRGTGSLEQAVEGLLVDLPANSPERAALVRFATLHYRWKREIASAMLHDPTVGHSLPVQLHGKQLVDAMRDEMAAVDSLSLQGVQDITDRTHRVQYFEAISIMGVIVIMGVFAFVTESRSMQSQEKAFAAITESSHTATRIGEWRMKVIAMLAHDFRSALAVISACTSVLEEFPEKREDPAPYRGIHESVEQLSDMTEEALLMARIASDVLPIKHDRVALEPVLKGVADRYRARHPIDVVAHDEFVLGDEAYLLRAFDNLVSNATKYSAPEQPVDIEARRTGNEIEVTIRDRGEGIDPKDLPLVFQEYWRSPHANEKAGVGIGLFIVKKIVDAHGGSIDVTSLPGIGTTIYVRLPAA